MAGTNDTNKRSAVRRLGIDFCLRNMTPNPGDIYRTKICGGVAVAWVNSYSAVVVKTRWATLLFDPVGMDVPEGVFLDLVAISHGHSDHWDPRLVARLQQRPESQVAAAPILAAKLENNPSSHAVRRLQPGDYLTVADATVTALRCDHAADEPLAFQVKTSDGVTVYLPGDTTPFQDMTQLPALHRPEGQCGATGMGQDNALQEDQSGVDVLVWMGTSLSDGARIAQLVRPQVFLTYAITPPSAAGRAYSILTGLTPEAPFQALDRHQVFVYPKPMIESI